MTWGKGAIIISPSVQVSDLLVSVSCGTRCGCVSRALHTQIHCTHIGLLGLGLPGLQACSQTRFILYFEWLGHEERGSSLPLLSPRLVQRDSALLSSHWQDSQLNGCQNRSCFLENLASNSLLCWKRGDFDIFWVGFSPQIWMSSCPNSHYSQWRSGMSCICLNIGIWCHFKCPLLSKISPWG